VDPSSGKVFHRYDELDLYDPDTEIVYNPVYADGFDQRADRSQDYEGSTYIDGKPYLPRRRHRRAASLRAELEAAGFQVLLQTGAYGQHVVCLLDSSPICDLESRAVSKQRITIDAKDHATSEVHR
jgi:hypothetical protein